MSNFLEGPLIDAENILKALDKLCLVSIADKNEKIVDINTLFCTKTKFNKKEIIDKKYKILTSGYHSLEFYQKIKKIIYNGEIWNGIIKNKTKDGKDLWVSTVIMPVRNIHNKIERFITIQYDITIQKKLSEKINQDREIIKQQLDELKIVDKQKEEFSSMISHELKTPLTPILAWTEFLKEPDISSDFTSEQQMALDGIQRNAEHLNHLLSDLLDVQKLDLKRMTFIYNEFNILELFTRLKNNFKKNLDEKQIEFKFDVKENFTMVSDEDRLEQVFSNLMRNDIEFIQVDGKITLGAEKIGDYAFFYVKDDGVGIPKKEQENIFKKFYQIDTSMKRKHGGTGLGLAVCKGIIEALGGKIWLESEIHHGTVFYITTPLSKKHLVCSN